MASSYKLLLLILVLLYFLHYVNETEAKARRSRGSFRTRSSSKTRRSSRTRSSYRRKSPPKQSVGRRRQANYRSSVSFRETRSFRKPFYKRFALVSTAGFLFYSASRSPIYRDYYRPYNGGSNIFIPRRRALRIQQEKYRVLTTEGHLCPINGSLVQLGPDYVKRVYTEISYNKTSNDVRDLPSQNSSTMGAKNFSISDKALKDYVTNIKMRIWFNESVVMLNESNVNNRSLKHDIFNCSVIEYESTAFVVEMINGCQRIMTFPLYILTFSLSFLFK